MLHTGHESSFMPGVSHQSRHWVFPLFLHNHGWGITFSEFFFHFGKNVNPGKDCSFRSVQIQMGLFEKCEIRQLTAWKKCCFFVFTFSFFWVSNRCMKSYFSWPSRFHALEWLTFFHKKRTFFRSWIWGAQSFGLNYSTFFLPENEQMENWKFV